MEVDQEKVECLEEKTKVDLEEAWVVEDLEALD
jgi:hypothetical protein